MKRIHLIVIIALLAFGGGIFVWHDMRDAREEVAQKPAEQKLLPKEVGQEQDLVWYEVSELGVRFKVTPDSRSDLKYTVVYDTDTKQYIAYFYSQSVHDFEEKQGIPCKFYKEDTPKIGESSSCGDFALRRVDFSIDKNTTNSPSLECERSIEKMRTEQYFICYSLGQAVPITGNRSVYESIYKDKKFGIFLDTMEDLVQED